MKKLRFILLPLLAFSLISCGGASDPGTSTSSGASDTSIDYDTDVTVNFYADYNMAVDGTTFKVVTVKNGQKLENPGTPQVVLPEFPVFKGCSTHEIINDLKYLWDFDKDVVMTSKPTLNLYGIWVAEGE